MRFDNGMLGMCISVLAIVGMILAGFALSVNQSERVVTGYEYVTDVSGLFDYSQDPQYVAYNPAANWTGFYTTDSDVTDGIDFDVSGSANNFPIKQPSTQISSNSQDLETLNLTQLNPPVDTDRGTMGPFWGIMWNTDVHFPTPNESTDSDYPRDYSPYPYVATLTTLVSALTTTGADRITINMGTGDSAPVVAPSSGWVYDEIRSTVEGMGNRYWDTYTLNLTDSERVTSITIALESGLCTGYAADGSTVWTGESASDLCIMYGFVESSTSGSGIQDQQLTSTVTVTLFDDPTPIYINTNEGVTLSDASVSWYNGYPVGSMDILFRVPDTGTAYTNTISVPLTSGPDGESVGTVNVYIAVASSGRVLVTISDGSNEQTMDIGQWRNFMLSMDFIGGSYSVTPVSSFATFNDYALSGNTRIFGEISLRGTAGTVTWGYTGSSLLFGVVDTTVFMNTYGVVMTDPSLAITEYFPELADVRLNFYSFALYGDSITINGQTFAVDDSAMITIPGGGTHTLTNIYITLEDRTSLTFVNDGVTVDLGPTTTDMISFSGNWYFTTGLYEGYETTETYYDWTVDRFIFESDGAVVVFLGLLVLGTAIGAKVVGIRTLDIVVVACAGLFGYVMLGVF